MAEPALALRDHPQIIDLISVLEQSGLQKQKEEVQALVGYIDGMEEKLSRNYLRIRVCLPSCGPLCCPAARRFLRCIVTRRLRWSESMAGAHR